MNIALIETHAIPGVWKYDICLAGEIAALGHTVTIISSRAFPDIEEVPRNVKIVRIFPNLKRHSTFIAKGLLYLVATLRTVWITLRGGFDIVHWQHFNTFPPAETVMALVFRAQRHKTVMTVHDVDAWSSVRGQSSALLKKTYRSADRIIVHHAANISDLETGYAIPRSQVDVVPHGSYTGFAGELPGRAESRDALDIPSSARVVLFFGEIRPEKGLINLIRAIGALRDTLPGLCLVVAGQPRHMDMDECLHAITELGIESNVITRLEYIADDDVQRYFAAADVVAIPYIAITQSGILFEAMTAGRPVVATDVGGVGPTVRENDVGLVVPPDDDEALAGAIKELLSDEDAVERMSKNGLRTSSSQFSWARCATETVAVYERVLQRAANG